jgi:NAD(P)-dependent dehydrogenase (short-subunit alcohol dehydrogenase family)
MQSTHNKPEVVVITGASAGLGRATVRAFAKQKAHIGLLARGKEGLDAAKREVEEAGGEACALPTDVADPAEVQRAADAVEEAFGPVDIWVNNAMTTVFAPLREITPDEFKRATDVTYLGTVYGTMAALKSMLGRNKGVIVQVGSALAYRSIPLQAPYCGAKHAIMGFTDSLRCELIHEHRNIHITMVHMPALNTPQFTWCKTKLPHHPQPVPPIYEPEVGAEAIFWAAHHRQREVWVGMPTVMAITGNKIAPGLLDNYLGRTGYDSQQSSDPVNPDRPSNLFEPVRGDYGAHGIFEVGATCRSEQLWSSMHKKSIAAGVGVVGIALALLLKR